MNLCMQHTEKINKFPQEQLTKIIKMKNKAYNFKMAGYFRIFQQQQQRITTSTATFTNNMKNKCCYRFSPQNFISFFRKCS